MGRRLRIGLGVEKARLASVAAMEEKAETRARRTIVLKRPDRPLTPAKCKGWVRRTMAEHMPDVLEGFLNEAVKGGCAHLKMATETVASKAAGPRGPKAQEGGGEVERLLEEFESREQLTGNS